ncbi:hypothetical protein LJC59_00885 [Desulfovibrio sp. OttesenSCG-928-A18]|nr:hypothetical protein [Desulfovibrio sp. OttesenSCG-928-A18]
MQATFNTADFFNALQSVKPALNLKGKAYLNDCVTIEAAKDSILITTENDDSRIVSRVPAEVTAPESIESLNYQALDSAAKSAKSAKVADATLSTDYDVIFQGAATQKIENAKHGSRPMRKQVESFPQNCLEVDRAELLRVAERMAFCAGDASHDGLSCIQLDFSDSRLLMSALNGHQCYSLTLQGEQYGAFSPGGNATLPRPDQFAQWVRAIPKSEKTIRLSATEDHFFAASQNSVYTSVFSPYNAIDISNFMVRREREAKSSVTFSRSGLVAILKTLLPSVTNDDRSIVFNFDDCKCSIMTHNRRASAEMPCEFYGDVNIIAFPLKNLLQIVENTTGDFVTLEFTNNVGPCFIGDGWRGVYVIMPMKILQSWHPDNCEAEDRQSQAA